MAEQNANEKMSDESPPAPRVLCERAALRDGGPAVRFDAMRAGQSVAGFVIAYEGEVFAYQNHCPHRGTELDWQPGEVFDETGLYLVCATHGAVFEPASGKCVGGPCRGASLSRIPVDVENHLVVIHANATGEQSPTTTAADSPSK